MKTLRKKNKEKDDFKIPKSVQDTIPVNKVYKDGIFLIDNLSNQVQQSNKYSLNNSLGVL